jgi:hypothetical protein
MIKYIENILLFLIPLTITYVVVSSIGTTGNYYGPPNPIGVPHSTLQKSHGN